MKVSNSLNSIWLNNESAYYVVICDPWKRKFLSIQNNGRGAPAKYIKGNLKKTFNQSEVELERLKNIGFRYWNNYICQGFEDY